MSDTTDGIETVLADLGVTAVVAEHDPGCPGDERYCMSHCPVPTQMGPDYVAAIVRAHLLSDAVVERAAEVMHGHTRHGDARAALAAAVGGDTE